MSETMSFNLKAETDVIASRKAARDLARDLGFGLADQTRIATAVSELTRNVLKYAGEGVCLLIDDSRGPIGGLSIVVEDHGPGISDIELALQDGYSTGGSLGAGLPGTKRLVHEFSLQSRPGHTRVTIAMRPQQLART